MTNPRSRRLHCLRLHPLLRSQKRNASDSQKGLWGIENSSEASKFDQLNYGYVIASAVALAGGAAAFASQVPEVREIAEQFNIELPRFF